VETSIGVDGTSIFAPSSAFREGQSVFLQRWHNIRAHTMTLKNSFELPFNSATKLAFTTNTSVQRLRSAGSSSSMSAQLRHRFSSKLNLTATTAVFKPHTTSIKVNYVPDSDSFITLAAASRTLARPPPLTLAFGRNIYKGMTSFVTLKTGTYSLGLWGSSERLSQTVPSLSLGLTSLKGWGLNMDTSVEGTSVSADWSHKPTKDSKIRLGALLTVTGGFNLSATGEHRIPYDSWLALVVSCGSQGLILRIRWRRLGQLLVVPVVLSREPEFLLAMQLLAVPAISVTLLQHAYLLPRKKRKLQAYVLPLFLMQANSLYRRLEELQKEHADQIEEQRKDANQVQLMLADQVRRRTTTEKSKDGLIIHSAWYGAIDGPERIDVRIPLQVLVQNSQLVIPGGRSKSGLLGFYDPCPGQPKQLTLEYEFGTRQHRITYADRDAVTLPLRLHLVD
jgi:DnaJ family protein C protein 11